jgi:hypothetical protein
MKYTIHGPFEMAKKNNKLVDHSNSTKKLFWSKVRKSNANLPSACGCYLFAIRAAKGIKPWYVGLAEKGTFESECYSAHKINIYNDALAGKKGAPLLFLIAKRTKKDKFVKPTKRKHQDIAYLETILIGVALKKNPKLMNIKKTKFLKKMCVPCLMNTTPGKPTRSEAEFKKAIKK